LRETRDRYKRDESGEWREERGERNTWVSLG